MKIFLVLIIILSLNFSANGQKLFYYAFGNKIELSVVKDQYVVTPKVATNILTLRNGIIGKKISNKLFLIDNLNSSDIINNSPPIRNIHPVFKTNAEKNFYATDEIALAFKSGVSDAQISSVINKFGLTLIKKTQIYELYQVPELANVLTISNQIFETGSVTFSYPNFRTKIESLDIPNDPFFSKQFYLHNTGQLLNENHTGSVDADIDAPEAWDITKGNNNIVVAVVDQGVSSNHPDLPNSRQVRLNGSNLSASWDADAPDANDPSPLMNDAHGNACAGIIAATQNNNEGITGIAPLCKIMPVRMTFNLLTPMSVFSDAIMFAVNNGASVISNSWGSANSDPNEDPMLVQAIQYAVTNGRNNKGCVVVCAAGNNGNTLIQYGQGTIHFPANVLINSVISVGASDRYDKQSVYSITNDPLCSCNQMFDVTAPSHKAFSHQIPTETRDVWTIDSPGNVGYNPWPFGDYTIPVLGEQLPSSGSNYLSYTGRMGGSSASTAVVSGIAALILSVNPNLTSQQVHDIIICSAEKVGGYDYNVFNSGVGNAYNIGLPGYSAELGYGRANAFKSVMNSCVASYSITWPILSNTTINYKAANSISASGSIANNTNVTITAGTQVALLPGFAAVPGSRVSINLAPCTYCYVPPIPIPRIGSSSDDNPSFYHENLVEEGLIVFPNPASTFINLELKNKLGIVSYSIINSNGIEVAKGNLLNAGDAAIPVGGLANGIYMVKATTNVKTYFKQLHILK